jgi:hypothetical protein
MVDTTPNIQNPQDENAEDQGPQANESEGTTTPIVSDIGSAAPAPLANPVAPPTPAFAPPAASAPVPAAPVPTAPRSRRGLILAGGIIAAVIVLGGTFGGGVLVGTSVSAHHGFSIAQRGPGGMGMQGGRETPDGAGFRGPSGRQPGSQQGGQPGSQQGGNGTEKPGGSGPGDGAGTGQGPTNG